MTPRTTRLKVCPKLPQFVGLAALLLLGLGSSLRSRSGEPLPRQSRKTQPLRPTPAKQEADPSEEATIARSEVRKDSLPAAPVAEVPPAPAPVEPPRNAMEDPALLQSWILGLPESDVRALDASGRLNRYLAQIATDVSFRHSDPQAGAREIDGFMSRFNAKLGVVAP